MPVQLTRPASWVAPVLSLLLVLIDVSACTQQTDTGFANALGLMKREQSLGEAYAGLLKQFAKDDMVTLAQGIQLYAHAQAEFNGLLETLKAELITGRELADSQHFSAGLQHASRQRVAFTDFIDQQVLAKLPKGTKSIGAMMGGAEFIKTVPDLITALKGAGLDIWREYQAAKSDRRQDILNQIDDLKWHSYEEVPALG